MTSQEGVIKYKLNHQHMTLAKDISISKLNAWRSIFFKLGLIGQIKGRYDGYGFGNISQRTTSVNAKNSQFIISGTQTGKLESLSKQHYCTVLEANPSKNTLKSAGEIKPSSEALTHASVYQKNFKIQFVIHIHCPEIWKNSAKLKLPCTSADIAYGTPEMAKAVERLFQTTPLQNTDVFCMLGHEDGIVAYSDFIEKAAQLLIKLFSEALAIEQNKQYG